MYQYVHIISTEVEIQPPTPQKKDKKRSQIILICL